MLCCLSSFGLSWTYGKTYRLIKIYRSGKWCKGRIIHACWAHTLPNSVKVEYITSYVLWVVHTCMCLCYYLSTERKYHMCVIVYFALISNNTSFSVADPGFPVGGRGPVRGGMDPRRRHFWWKCMWKWKNWVP